MRVDPAKQVGGGLAMVDLPSGSEWPERLPVAAVDAVRVQDTKRLALAYFFEAERHYFDPQRVADRVFRGRV